MAKHTAEDYVQAILQISLESKRAVAPTGVLARRLNVTAGTVSSRVRSLADDGLVVFVAYEGSQLTEKGRQMAVRVLRRRRLVELFLSRVLELPRDEIRAEAERIEPAISDQLMDRIDRFLGYPKTDPHGDPIPTADGALASAAELSLAGCEVGDKFTVSRVTDQTASTLRYLASLGVHIGQGGEVQSNSPIGGVLSLNLDGQSVTISRGIAAKILVRREV